MVIRQILEDRQDAQIWASWAMESFAEEDGTGNNEALEAAQKMDETLQKARGCLFRLYDALRGRKELTEEVKEILCGHESQISELEQINIEADRIQRVDNGIFNIQNVINNYSHQIISQFPGVLDDFDLSDRAPIPFSRFVELSRDRRKLQFIPPRQTLESMCSPALILHNILEGQDDADAYKELLKNLEIFCILSSWQGDEMQRQLWLLQDLHNGGGLGFTVELFFLSLSQLLSTSQSTTSHSALYTGTFRAITSDWSKHKNSLGTQKLLLGIVMSRRWDFNIHYPAYIVDEFLSFLDKIFEGQTGPHIDRAREHFESLRLYDRGWFWEGVLKILTDGQGHSPAS